MNTSQCIYNALTYCNSDEVLSFLDSPFLMVMCSGVFGAYLCTNTYINPWHVSLLANAGACFPKQGNLLVERFSALYRTIIHS